MVSENQPAGGSGGDLRPSSSSDCFGHKISVRVAARAISSPSTTVRVSGMLTTGQVQMKVSGPGGGKGASQYCTSYEKVPLCPPPFVRTTRSSVRDWGQ